MYVGRNFEHENFGFSFFFNANVYGIACKIRRW